VIRGAELVDVPLCQWVEANALACHVGPLEAAARPTSDVEHPFPVVVGVRQLEVLLVEALVVGVREALLFLLALAPVGQLSFTLVPRYPAAAQKAS
jgi:hypothetical protein